LKIDTDNNVANCRKFCAKYQQQVWLVPEQTIRSRCVKFLDSGGKGETCADT